MSEATPKYTKWKVWIVIAVLVLGGIWLFDQKQKTDECKNRALIASVNAYPFSVYPDTVRGRLQSDYEQRYISQICNNQ